MFLTANQIRHSLLRTTAAVVLCGLAACESRPVATFDLAVRPQANDPTRIVVAVTASSPAAWPARVPGTWESVLSVRLVTGRFSAQVPVSEPLLCSYELSGHELRLAPRYPLLAGEKYEVRFDATAIPGASLQSVVPLTRVYEVPAAAAGPVPKILAIYPSGESVPANHLKFYLVFSEPMRAGGIFKHFRLLDEQGGQVPDPFRETELWANDGKRLTLWFHPGRQKTGVNLNVEIGPILTEDRRFTLEIAGEWVSQAGMPLGKTVRKTLRAGPPDHAQPDIVFWQLQPPPAGTREKLVVIFPEPLDWALLQSQLWIETSGGNRVPGMSHVGPGETSWEFVPEQPWVEGAFRLAIGTVLEDLAGNSVARPFQVDVQKAAPKKAPETVYKPFNVASSGR